MQTDYAILALGYLSRAAAGRPVPSREIAERYSIPSELLAKILQKIAREGWVRSHAGACGGYTVACALDGISVADVLRVIEGPLHLVRCVGDSCCQIAPACDIIKPMRAVHDRVVNMLGEISIAEITCGANALNLRHPTATNSELSEVTV